MNYPKVSIIILNWNGLDDTIACLESLKNITYPNYEVIVVDNGSIGDDAQVLKEQFGDHIYLIENDRNYGFAEGNNIGIRHVLEESTPDYILLLNNDTVAGPDFLNELVNVAEQDCSIGIASPKIYSYSHSSKLLFTTAKIDLWKGRTVQVGIGEIDSGQYDSIQDTDNCEGTCFLIRREVIQSIGMLDSSYFKYFEETDYCLRAREGGFRCVYCPWAKIWHKGWTRMWDKSFASSVRVSAVYYLERNRFLFMRKHASKLQIATFLFYYFAFQFWLTGGHFLVRRRSPQVLTFFLRGVKDGLQLLMSRVTPNST
jgi:GT2 family glycosyltransferase